MGTAAADPDPDPSNQGSVIFIECFNVFFTVLLNVCVFIFRTANRILFKIYF